LTDRLVPRHAADALVAVDPDVHRDLALAGQLDQPLDAVPGGLPLILGHHVGVAPQVDGGAVVRGVGPSDLLVALVAHVAAHRSQHLELLGSALTQLSRRAEVEPEARHRAPHVELHPLLAPKRRAEQVRADVHGEVVGDHLHGPERGHVEVEVTSARAGVLHAAAVHHERLVEAGALHPHREDDLGTAGRLSVPDGGGEERGVGRSSAAAEQGEHEECKQVSAHGACIGRPAHFSSLDSRRSFNIRPPVCSSGQ
jgi:hypothetical protein